MRVDVIDQSQRDSICEELRSFFQLEPRVSIGIYRGIAQAFMELCPSLTATAPQKKNIQIAAPLGPYFKPLAQYLSSLEFHIGTFEWNSPFQTDNLFYLWMADDPITGVVYQGTVQTEKVYQIRLSHNLHLRRLPEILPYQIEVMSFGPDLCVILFGERVRLKTNPLSQLVFWEHDVLAQIQSLQAAFIEDEAKIRHFEDQVRPHFQPLIKHSPRLWDRAVIYAEDIDGTAILSTLYPQCKSPGLEARIETASLCRWHPINQFTWLIEQNFTLAQLRGSLIVSLKELTTDFVQTLISAKKAILELQGAPLT